MSDAQNDSPQQRETSSEPKKSLREQLYELVSFKDELAKYRDQANAALASVGSPLAVASALTTHPAVARDIAQDKLLDFSARVNSEYPLAGSLCNTHRTLIVASASAFVAVPTLRIFPRKFAFATIAVTALSTKAALFAVNYKWRQDSSSRESP